MSYKDGLEKDITLLKNLIIVFLTSLIGAFGYAIANIDKLKSIQLILGSIGVIFLVFSLIFTIIKYIQQNKLLKDLDD